jgi:hypothetical protein
MNSPSSKEIIEVELADPMRVDTETAAAMVLGEAGSTSGRVVQFTRHHNKQHRPPFSSALIRPSWTAQFWSFDVFAGSLVIFVPMGIPGYVHFSIVFIV